MTVADFEKQPRGPFLFDRWQSKQRLETPMGEFVVEVHAPPDDEMLGLVNELVAFVKNSNEEVLDKVYEHYQRLAQHREWMRGCGVPTKLSRTGVVPYLRSRNVVVMRDGDRLVGSIYIDPEWDTEHKIDLEIRNGSLAFNNS